MSKIIKKSDIIKLSESTMRQVGLLGENEELDHKTYNQLRDDVTYFLMDEGYNVEEISTMDLMDLMNIVEDIYNTTEDSGKLHHIEQMMADYEYLVDMDNDKHGKKEVEIEDEDVVSESVKKLSNEASKHNIISENLKKDLTKFNKIINYKY